jgi:uncharacterized iron-regulated membrane protein
MTPAELAGVMRQILLALGLLFVIVNVRVGWQIASWWRRRARAVVVWAPPKPPFYAINLAIGVLLGVLLFVSAYLLRPTVSLFGVAMMFVYYGYLLPLSTRIKRGLYEEGIWTDSGFMRYADIGGLAWKGNDTLVLASRLKTTARRLSVPGIHLGEVRHFLREKISAHDIEFAAGPGIHLGTRDTRESV